MDAEKSSNSSFEDLSNINESELKDAQQPAVAKEESGSSDVLDIIGNGQLIKKILKEGDSSLQPQRGDLCRISYTGRLESGETVEKQSNVTIQQGDVELVQGLDMALALMKVGEIAEITVHPRFAYGEIGLRNDQDKTKAIPPNATIIYTVELYESNEEEDLDTQSYKTRKETGNRKRDRGNFWYEREEYNLAIQLYRRALEYLDENSVDRDTDDAVANAQLRDLLEDRVKAYNNLAAAQMKNATFDTALVSVDNALRCQPDNVKALFRKGKILDAKGDTNAAIPILQKAATLDADNKTIQQLLGKLIMKSRRDARNEKDLYQKMLGHAQKMEQKAHRSKSDTNVSPKLKLWGYLMGSILIGVAGVAMYRYKYF